MSRGRKKKRFLEKKLFSKINFILKQRVDSYNFRLEIYLRFFPRKKFTNPFSMELFFKSGKDLLSKKKKKIQKVFSENLFEKETLSRKILPKNFVNAFERF